MSTHTTEDLVYLCGACGCLVPVREWRDVIFDGELLVTAPAGAVDPLAQCPRCAFLYRDDDANPPVFSGTWIAMVRQRREMVAAGEAWWAL